MKRIKLKLNRNSIEKAIKEIKNYQTSLQIKNERFVERLLEVGISVANQNRGRYTSYIAFEKELESGDKQVVGILSGRNTQPCISWWYYKGGKKQVTVNALAMAEFGSGWLAEVLFDVTGVGQGTFPGQKHATDEMWYWRDGDENGKILHVSRGELPTHPFYNAEMQMLDEIDAIAREVFESDI